MRENRIVDRGLLKSLQSKIPALLPMSTSSATSKKIEDQVEELMFLAEVLSEQVQLIDSFQSRHLVSRCEESADAANETDAVRDARFADILELVQTEIAREAELGKRESDLARREERLRGQRKALAAQFKAERARLVAEKQDLKRQRDELAGREPAGADLLVELESRLQELTEILQKTDDENRRLKSEVESLNTSLANLEGATPENMTASQVAEVFDLRRRLEVTLEELQQARNEIQRLKSGNVSESIDGGGSWEETKRALLASLEGECETEPSSGDHRQLLHSLQKAEQAIQQKNETIKQLEALLAEQESEANREQESRLDEQRQVILDESEVIAAEKERLQELQEQWRKNIGEAEIDLSKERARLARERASLQEKQQELEKLQRQLTGENESGAESSDTIEPVARRKWWQRLGLK